MRLTELIDLLSQVERRHTGESIDVEVRDDAGVPTTEFQVKTEYILTKQRITVKLVASEHE